MFITTTTSRRTIHSRKPKVGAPWLRSLLGDNFFGEVKFVGLSPNFARRDLKALELLTHTEILRLDNSRLTDDDLVHLKELTQLRVLGLSGTEVTDEGLGNLLGLTNLDLLTVNGTKVTAAGITKFHKALPGCGVSF